MKDLSLHLAPHTPTVLLALLTAGALALGWWAYRFAIPPLPAVARRLLPALRIVALAILVWLLAQPVLERPGGGTARLVVLEDASASMGLPAAGGASRASRARDAVEELRRAWRGRAGVEVFRFAAHLAPDSGRVRGASATALGDALAELAASPSGERANGVVVVSDGAVNAGDDPVAAARGLGVPVHAVVVGDPSVRDRLVATVESSTSARVGQATLVRARIATTEPPGTPLDVRLLDGGREIGRARVTAPGGGAEATAEFRVIPSRPGLAVWTAVVDSLPGEITAVNNARQIAVEVSPGRLGVTIVSAGLNWDLAFLRRALLGDSSFALSTWVRERSGWRRLEGGGGGGPGAALRGQALVVLDALSPADLGAGFDGALAGFVRGGGGLLVLGGGAPGLARLRTSRLGAELGVRLDPGRIGRTGAPVPAVEAHDLLAWDDDPAQGDRAWRASAPLSDVAPIAPGAGDRVLVSAGADGPPLLFARRVGRGQALLVNGAGIWRWSLSGADERTAERGRRLWRRLARWLAEPAQGEPLRVRPERWLTSSGEVVRLFGTLQDAEFRPVEGATVEGEVEDAARRVRRVRFEPRPGGTYVATLADLPAGRYAVRARASLRGAERGRATTEFAVDRWSLELARTRPDSAGLAAMAQAAGGRVTPAENVGRWARALGTRALATRRTDSLKLWESPWLFAIVVGCLSVEWAWRRRRGLP